MFFLIPAKRVLPKEFHSFSNRDKTNFFLKFYPALRGEAANLFIASMIKGWEPKLSKDSSYPLAVLKRLPESGRELGIAIACRPYLMAVDARAGGKRCRFLSSFATGFKRF